MNPLTKISPLSDLKDWIRSTTYTRLPSGTAIVCEITLYSGHLVHGISKVIDMENYDEAVGTKAAYDLAVDQVFDYIAFVMHEKMHRQEIPNRHAELVQAYQYPAVQIHPTTEASQ